MEPDDQRLVVEGRLSFADLTADIEESPGHASAAVDSAASTERCVQASLQSKKCKTLFHFIWTREKLEELESSVVVSQLLECPPNFPSA